MENLQRSKYRKGCFQGPFSHGNLKFKVWPKTQNLRQLLRGGPLLFVNGIITPIDGHSQKQIFNLVGAHLVLDIPIN